MTVYISERDHRFWHSADAIAHIEELNCSLGCRNGAKTDLEREVFGPGGVCDVLAVIAAGGGDPVPEIDDDGETLTCVVREPL